MPVQVRWILHISSLRTTSLTFIQRILRYKLLLEVNIAQYLFLISIQELIKVTPADHEDYKTLQTVLTSISETAVNVNEKIREEENFQILCRIQKRFVGNVKVHLDGRMKHLMLDIAEYCGGQSKVHQRRSYHENLSKDGQATVALLVQRCPGVCQCCQW